MGDAKQTPFWLFSIAVLLALILPVLVQDGMFMDGMLYSCVAHNLANGIGSFWYPEFSELGFANSTVFREHPPLVFNIQAFFFRILGDSMYVERFYSLLTALITANLINKIWNLLAKQFHELTDLGWLPILLWILVPVGFWAFQNNMIENTMGIFTLLSVFFSLSALYSKEKMYLKLIVSGIFIFLASFSKGPPGLFPLGVLGLYWIINRDGPFLRIALYTSILLAVPALIYALLLLDPNAYETLSSYVNDRLLGRIASAPTADSRFFIVERLGMELIPPLLLVFIMLAVFKIKSIKQSLEKPYTKITILFFAIGLSGSIPLALTMVQKGFYFTPALPFFGIGFALLIAPGIKQLTNRLSPGKISFRVLRSIMAMLLAAVLVVSALQVGKFSRNRDLLHDVYMIGDVIPTKELIGIDKSMWLSWDLQCYLIRYFYISVDYNNPKGPFYLIEKDSAPPKDFEKVDLPTRKYDLYQKIL